jgi:isopentenyldiphosphate isomerase
MATKTWNGTAMSQEDMMEKDTVLVLDDEDRVIGSASKHASHEFIPSTPRGVLHRAFSVFLFDESTGELLLQKRASTKITFPNVRISCYIWEVENRYLTSGLPPMHPQKHETTTTHTKHRRFPLY